MCSNAGTLLAMKQKGSNKKKRKIDSLESNCELLEPNSSSRELPLDVGTDGVKNAVRNRSCSIMMTGSERTFQVPMTPTEKKKRKQRQARFGQPSLVEKEIDNVDDVVSKVARVDKVSYSCGSMNCVTKTSIAVVTEPSNTSSLVGTNQNLEKPYLRLTTFPKAEDVRPLEVLVKSLAMIKRRYIQEEDFDWANEQLKSLRQDITVQGLRNKVVLDAYETHARILLENGDLSEFNQCQTMIRTMTSGQQNSWDHLGATSTEDDKVVCPFDQCSRGAEQGAYLVQSDEAADEFAAYGILYALVQYSNVVMELLRSLCFLQHEDYDHNTSKKLSDDSKSSTSCNNNNNNNNGYHLHKASSCRHALQVVKAVVHNDYRGFFRLYESGPHLSAYLMDFLVKRVRDAAYDRIVHSYRPTISVEFFREALYFPNLKETRIFLRTAGAVFVKEKGEPLFWVDCKASK